jgi:hypothetical protein
VRYLDNGLSGRANLTAPEVQDLRANGVAIAVVWEKKIIGQPDRATAGYAAGQVDARAADVQCTAVGLPGWPVYMAVDFDIPDYAPNNPDPRAKLGPVGDYLAGALSVLGPARMGVYGGYWAVSRALDAGLVKYVWQTMAWSGANVEKRAHLIQRIGSVWVDKVECDVNESKQDDFGQQQKGMVDELSWTEMISPDGLVDKDGKQITDKPMNFLGYADQAAQDAKAQSVANAAKLDALMAKLDVQATAEQQRDAELLAAVKSVTLGTIDPNKVADALLSAGLAQAQVQALLAVLNKAASTPAAG